MTGIYGIVIIARTGAQWLELGHLNVPEQFSHWLSPSTTAAHIQTHHEQGAEEFSYHQKHTLELCQEHYMDNLRLYNVQCTILLLNQTVRTKTAGAI